MRISPLTAGSKRVVGSRIDLPLGAPASDLVGLVPMAGQVLNIADKPKLAVKMAALQTLATNFLRTYSNTSAASAFSNLTWFNNLYVMHGYTGAGYYILTSPDGFNWTQRASVSQTNAVTDFAQLGTRLFLLSDQNYVHSSDDGITWTQRATNAAFNGSSLTLRGMRTINGQLVAYGRSTVNSVITACVWTSPDGITWTQRTTAFSGSANAEIRDLTFFKGLYVAVGLAGMIQTSPDLITWTARANPTTDALYAIANNGVKLIAAGVSGRSLTSVDAINWSKGIINNGISQPNRLIYANNLWVLISSAVALDGRARILVSADDGATWRSERPDATENAIINPNAIVQVGNRFAVIAIVNGVAGVFITQQPTLDIATQFYVPAVDAGFGMQAYIVAE